MNSIEKSKCLKVTSSSTPETLPSYLGVRRCCAISMNGLGQCRTATRWWCRAITTFSWRRDKVYARRKREAASKLVARWSDGTPVELSPDMPNQAIVKDKQKNVYSRWAIILMALLRTNPRDAFGFNGRLVNRSRVTRHGLPYGPYVSEDQPVPDDGEHGIIFMTQCQAPPAV